MVPRQYRMKNTSHVINLPFFFQLGFFFVAIFHPFGWIDYRMWTIKKRINDKIFSKMNERCFDFCIAFWKWFRNAHDAISFNCSNHCWSFLDEMYWMLMLSCESEILFELRVPKMNTRFYRFTLKRMF